jgi:hypothetical protein
MSRIDPTGLLSPDHIIELMDKTSYDPQAASMAASYMTPRTTESSVDSTQPKADPLPTAKHDTPLNELYNGLNSGFHPLPGLGGGLEKHPSDNGKYGMISVDQTYVKLMQSKIGMEQNISEGNLYIGTSDTMAAGSVGLQSPALGPSDPFRVTGSAGMSGGVVDLGAGIKNSSLTVRAMGRLLSLDVSVGHRFFGSETDLKAGVSLGSIGTNLSLGPTTIVELGLGIGARIEVSTRQNAH